MALYKLEISPKALGLDVFGMTAEPGRPVYEYVDGERTDTQRTNEAGQPLWRHPVLLRVPGETPFESSIMLDQEAGPGEFAPLVLDASSRVTIRGTRSEYGGLDLNVTGSIVKQQNK